ncbi:rhombosortase [Gilvimarinus sp. DA14]|uniref:rhombosortase n=1 Tax=Gilvimarinus sp. DA14 TaxID=2956798 RepID=UPI0020B8323B|nr:rhombosortase [Gilvimarinus sp. DA14]UTF60152.1 rhombosortase [Gilvimarinus sp. DA14]
MKTLVHHLLIAFALGLPLLLLGYNAELLNPLLEYQRAALDDGQLWRLFSAHIVHLNLIHSAMNAAALLLILFWAGAERQPVSIAVSALFCALFISVCLYVWQPQVSYYVGLSGVLHGLLVFLLAPICTRNDPVGWAVILALGVKLCYERIIPGGHSATEVLIAGPVLSVAHLYGALGGAVLSFLWILAVKLAAWRGLQRSN